MAKKMTATLKFRTLQARDWVLTKDFEDQKHIDNFTLSDIDLVNYKYYPSIKMDMIA